MQMCGICLEESEGYQLVGKEKIHNFHSFFLGKKKRKEMRKESFYSF